MPTEENERLRRIMDKLRDAVSDWEASPYYLAEEELFDLERFLRDHEADDVREAMEAAYGRPLNRSFWPSLIAYHRLKRVRGALKEEEALHEEKRRAFLEAVERAHRTWREWLEEWVDKEKRPRLRLVRPPEKEAE